MDAITRDEVLPTRVAGQIFPGGPAPKPTPPAMPPPPPQPVDGKGLSRADIQQLLSALGYDVSGGAESAGGPEAAIRAFQTDVGLGITGEVNLETLMALLSAALRTDRRSATPGSASPHGTPSGVGPEKALQTLPVDTSNWKPGASDVTPKQLREIVPTLTAEKAAEVAPHLNRAMAEAGIDSPPRKAAFIAQLAHESGGFQYSEEIASGSAYEGRSDLGNTQPGDGKRFKGRGFIQLTGRANYAAAGEALGLDLINKPELAAKPENAARVAAWYWNSRDLNGLADRGNFDGITKRINGGFNGKADRDQYFARASTALRDSTGLPSTGRFAEAMALTSSSTATTKTATTAATADVDRNHPDLLKLATGKLAGARAGLCVIATLNNMQNNGVPQPAATGRDEGNNPRGGMVQMVNDFGWRSLPGAGDPQQIKSPYGTIAANVIPAETYERMARNGEIPSGAVVFQTRHASWNQTSKGSRGFDMGLARNGGRTLFNFADMGGPMVYGSSTRSVVVLVPGGSIR